MPTSDHCHCGKYIPLPSCPAATYPLGHFTAPTCVRLFLPERDGRISYCCSPARMGLCGFPPRDNRRDKHRMLTRHSDADNGAAADGQAAPD
jgi:hypothetical protein